MKLNSTFKLILFAILLILLNFLSKFDYYRFDLTEDKRYTLSKITKNILDSLDETVYCQFYLEGNNLPANFLILKNEAIRIFTEYQEYSNDKIQFVFVNPFDGNAAQNADMARQLTNAGLQKVDLTIRKDLNNIQTSIFPSGFIKYKNKQVIVSLFNNQITTDRDKAISNSIQNLEYEITNAIKKLTKIDGEYVAFLDGHKELENIQILDIANTMAEYYKIRRLILNDTLEKLDSISAIIISNPSKPFNEKEKYILDQYFMNGGNIVWLIEKSTANADSMKINSYTIAKLKNLNLDDMLFTYGVRIEDVLVQDLIQCITIPVITSYQNNQPVNSLLPWYYSPLGLSTKKHPISKNIEFVNFDFASTITTIENGLNVIPLLQTSPYTRIVELNFPKMISLKILKDEIKKENYNGGVKNLAVLVEGNFTSNYINRPIPEGVISKSNRKQKNGLENGKMLVVSDADFITSKYDERRNQYYPVGYDPVTRQYFGNKDFFLNALNYITNKTNLVELRGRKFIYRFIDKVKAKDEKKRWQYINSLLPIMLIIICGFIRRIYRKNKYSKIEKTLSTP